MGTYYKKHNEIWDGSGEHDGVPAGEFDYYLLTAEYCTTSNEEVQNKCRRSTIPQKKNLSLHGLWPQNTAAGKYPAYCTDSPDCPTGASGKDCPLKWSDLSEENQRFLEINMPVNPTDLADHEWRKHGTCSNLGMNDYFDRVRKAFSSFPTQPSVSSFAGKSTTYQAIQDGYSHQVLLQCDFRNDSAYLLSVVSCWSKDDTQQIHCNPNLQGTDVNNCPQTGSIEITEFRSAVNR